MLVQECLIRSCERSPGKTALVCGDKRYTYWEILSQSQRLAAALQEAGLRRRDRVLIFCENSIEAVVSIYGVLIAGGIFIILNPAMKARKLAYIINNSGARIIIAPFTKSAVIGEATAETSSSPVVFWASKPVGQLQSTRISAWRNSWEEILASASPHLVYNGTIDIDLATIIYTSGSTGEPKGVMSTHRNMLAAAESIVSYLQNTPDDIVLNTLPLSFDYGLYQLIMTFLFGGTLVLEQSFAYPYRILERIAQETVTGFPIVPTIAALLLQSKYLSRFDFRSLRYISNTAAALPVSHIRRLINLFPSVRIYSMYGLTECKRVSYMPPEKLAERPGSVGFAIPNSEVTIVDDHGEKVESNQVGELVVRGPHVMQGYWKSPDETAKRFKPGHYRADVLLYTGDLFRSDEEGYLYFVARKDDMIKTKGERVSPKEVENVLCEMEGVAEAAVVGVPDEMLGQAIKAFVVWSGRGEASAAAVLHHCKRHLEPFMIPREVEFRDSLPRTSSGKIDKKMLKKMLEA